MVNTVTLHGRVRNQKTIEIEEGTLEDMIDEEVVVVIRKARKSLHSKKMLDEMRAGKNIGYTRINREDIYRP